MTLTFKFIELLLRQKLLGKGLKGELNVPVIVSFAVTRECNLRCSHCHASAREAMSDELSMKEAMRAIEEMRNLGTQVLIFSGGEPLLRKDFVVNLASLCIDVGIIPAILTNGQLLTDKMALELKDAGIAAVGIPIDSVVPENHDMLRCSKGAFEKAVRAIKSCLAMDLEVVVTTMALSGTLDEIPLRTEFLRRLGVNQVAIYDLVPTGRGKDVIDQAMTQSQRISLIRYLRDVQEKEQMVFTISGGQPLYPEIVTQLHKSRGTRPRDCLLKQFWVNSPIGCHAGLLYFSLRPNGDVFPCTFLPLKVGNIRQQSLSTIWYHSEVLNKLRQRKLLKGRCGECDYREYCGGCRGRAYALTGDYLESDPACLEELLREVNVAPAAVERFGFCVG